MGDGTTTNHRWPAPVLNLDGIAAIAAHDTHSLALQQNGTVWAWGDNSWGGLGDGTTTERNTPMPVLNLSGVTTIAVGLDHSLAIVEKAPVAHQ